MFDDSVLHFTPAAIIERFLALHTKINRVFLLFGVPAANVRIVPVSVLFGFRSLSYYFYFSETQINDWGERGKDGDSKANNVVDSTATPLASVVPSH